VKSSFNQQKKNLCASIFLITMLAAAGCTLDNDNSGKISLDGIWLSDYGDGFIIDLIDNTLAYDFGGGYIGYSGNIKEIKNFNSSGTAGIIFIEYTIKPVDYNTSEEPAGNFIGIYFRNLTAASGQFASPSGPAPDYITPAQVSLTEAKSSFTEGTMGDYISYWAAYVKQ
jgi:hypothetical protein